MCFRDCLYSPEEREEVNRNNEIDKKLASDKKSEERIVKLLLLGSGESGKSTFIKQLRIINGEGFDNEYRSEFAPVIRSNLLQAVRSILSAMTVLYIEFESPRAKEDSLKVMEVLNDVLETPRLDGDELLDVPSNMLMSISTSIEVMWKDGGFLSCFDRNREYQLIDSARYYLDKSAEICSPNFKPTDQDVLRSRKRTTKIVEYPFDIKKVQLKVIDVGGQRKERRKWIQCFDNVTSIIFLCSLSDYDLKIQENNETNRMKESLELFGTILAYPWFRKKSMILFLNKTDLFEMKLPRSRLSDYFPDYQGDDNDIESAKEFIKLMYESKKPPPEPREDPSECIHIFPHFTCATDTDNITKVFKDVQEIILRTYLNEFNLV